MLPFAFPITLHSVIVNFSLNSLPTFCVFLEYITPKVVKIFFHVTTITSRKISLSLLHFLLQTQCFTHKEISEAQAHCCNWNMNLFTKFIPPALAAQVKPLCLTHKEIDWTKNTAITTQRFISQEFRFILLHL